MDNKHKTTYLVYIIHQSKIAKNKEKKKSVNKHKTAYQGYYNTAKNNKNVEKMGVTKQKKLRSNIFLYLLCIFIFQP